MFLFNSKKSCILVAIINFLVSKFIFKKVLYLKLFLIDVYVTKHPEKSKKFESFLFEKFNLILDYIKDI